MKTPTEVAEVFISSLNDWLLGGQVTDDQILAFRQSLTDQQLNEVRRLWKE